MRKYEAIIPEIEVLTYTRQVVLSDKFSFSGDRLMYILTAKQHRSLGGLGYL